MSVTIRPAAPDDCAQIAEIYRHYVDHSVITFDYESPSVGEWQTKRAAIDTAGRPFLVGVEHDGTVVGFAYLNDFRPKQAYDWTVEDTIYLHPRHVGHGTGRRLLTELIAAARPETVRRVIAVIAVIDNDASVRLHARAGFTEVGTLRRVGFKHDTWVDCVFMQLDLDPGDDPDIAPG
ncbi:GNAT family N-acetyltransferase [Williamsia sterculiae]|uniref:Phosphinothricin acetyltransferase n=1 Tax=Williamsia sterculiae TaxID=1344003 RepID=A0A1N7DQ42_9NOCA|nr:GNAT family N-acetyltransferase [Williamsia sterculiae]SIR77805.1 phosphinothricin acetyltransferase [Williamsia sterculiae]